MGGLASAAEISAQNESSMATHQRNYAGSISLDSLVSEAIQSAFRKRDELPLYHAGTPRLPA